MTARSEVGDGVEFTAVLLLPCRIGTSTAVSAREIGGEAADGAFVGLEGFAAWPSVLDTFEFFRLNLNSNHMFNQYDRVHIS